MTEKINELSKKTLRRYVKKSDDEVSKNISRGGTSLRGSEKKKHTNRVLGHGAATDRLRAMSSGQSYQTGVEIAKNNKKEFFSTEDVVNEPSKKTISEISKQKAYDYIAHASIDKSFRAHDNGRMNFDGTRNTPEGRAEQEKNNKRHGRRSWGIQVAASKLAGKGLHKSFSSKVAATEETAVNEGSHVYHVVGDRGVVAKYDDHDSNRAIRHMSKLEDSTGKVHHVHRVSKKDGKITKSWSWSDSQQRYAPHDDWKGDHFNEDTNSGTRDMNINELSKKTLGGYIKAAAHDKVLNRVNRDEVIGKYKAATDGIDAAMHPNVSGGDGDSLSASRYRIKKAQYKAEDDFDRRDRNRNTGISRAVKRLTRENADVNEDMKEFSNPTGRTPIKVVDALGKTTTDGLGKGVSLLEAVVAEDAVAVEDIVDSILRAKVMEALYGEDPEDPEEEDDDQDESDEEDEGSEE